MVFNIDCRVAIGWIFGKAINFISKLSLRTHLTILFEIIIFRFKTTFVSRAEEAGTGLGYHCGFGVDWFESC